MPNDLSNEFHADLDALKAEFEKVKANLESGASTVLADLKVVFTQTVDAAGPLLVAAASAAVTAALGSVTGGASAVVTAALGAATSLLESQGKTLLETEGTQLQALVVGNVLKASTTSQDPSGSAPTPTSN